MGYACLELKFLFQHSIYRFPLVLAISRRTVLPRSLEFMTQNKDIADVSYEEPTIYGPFEYGQRR